MTGCIVTPGLIDLHTHVYWGGTSLGVDADAYGRQSGVTTCVDTGSVGPGNYPGFLKHVIKPAQTRILAYLNISFAGIYGFSGTISVDEAKDMRLMAVREAVAMALDNPESVIGIKVRIGKRAGGTSSLAPLDLALDAADPAGLPLMCHIDEAPPTYSVILDRLRPGDGLTHAFRPFPNAPVLAGGTVYEAVHSARARGVIFDIGHGMGSFYWDTARAMMAAGFSPDTISSDMHALCLHGLAWDPMRTMTKLLALCMPLPALVTATTTASARGPPPPRHRHPETRCYRRRQRNRSRKPPHRPRGCAAPDRPLPPPPRPQRPRHRGSLAPMTPFTLAQILTFPGAGWPQARGARKTTRRRRSAGSPLPT